MIRLRALLCPLMLCGVLATPLATLRTAHEGWLPRYMAGEA